MGRKAVKYTFVFPYLVAECPCRAIQTVSPLDAHLGT